mmetsp:Transcript_7358/g.19680  ORF Transcript_7358/g.19680 Transcript_7358/m.19680 type:complete len:364 (+) Transcript_7358:317-1408(+)
MKLLREIQHPNVIALRDVFPLKKNIALVLPFMESDLEAVIRDRAIILSPGHIKSFMKMLLSALDACHSNWIVHRDVKPNNCLLASDGQLVLADFGLARTLASPERDKTRPYTHQVFARWYRPPELFFGASSYGFGIDVWAAGCIFAELLLRRPWFPGNNDIDQLGKIFQALGTPNESTWPGLSSLPAYVEFQPVTAPPLRSLFPAAVSADALDLLGKMVSLNPAHRPTAAEALSHSYFTSDPPPTPHHLLPRPKLRDSQPQPAVIDYTQPPQKRPNQMEALQRAAGVAGGKHEGHDWLPQGQQGVAGNAAAGHGSEGGVEDGRPAKKQRQGLVKEGAGGAGGSCTPSDAIGKFSPACSPPVRT